MSDLQDAFTKCVEEKGVPHFTVVTTHISAPWSETERQEEEGFLRDAEGHLFYYEYAYSPSENKGEFLLWRPATPKEREEYAN